jgi:hypothetical protein
MNNIVNQQTVVVNLLVSLLCLAFLLGVFLTLNSITGPHPLQTGIMLIDPPYHLV